MCRINVGAVPLDGDSDARGTKRSVGSCELGLDAWQMRTSHSLTDIAYRLTRKPLDIRELGRCGGIALRAETARQLGLDGNERQCARQQIV